MQYLGFSSETSPWFFHYVFCSIVYFLSWGLLVPCGNHFDQLGLAVFQEKFGDLDCWCSSLFLNKHDVTTAELHYLWQLPVSDFSSVNNSREVRAAGKPSMGSTWFRSYNLLHLHVTRGCRWCSGRETWKHGKWDLCPRFLWWELKQIPGWSLREAQVIFGWGPIARRLEAQWMTALSHRLWPQDSEDGLLRKPEILFSSLSACTPPTVSVVWSWKEENVTWLPATGFMGNRALLGTCSAGPRFCEVAAGASLDKCSNSHFTAHKVVSLRARSLVSQSLWLVSAALLWDNKQGKVVGELCVFLCKEPLHLLHRGKGLGGH